MTPQSPKKPQHPNQSNQQNHKPKGSHQQNQDNRPNKNNHRPKRKKPIHQHQTNHADAAQDESTSTQLQKNDKNLYITCLGGLEEVGKNITVFEHAGDILVIDCGLKFATPQMPGVDYTVPDLSYLERNQHRIVGLLITHAHLDHIGAVPYFLKRLNKVVYATRFTRAMIEKSVADKAPEVKLRTKEIKAGKAFQLGSFHIEPIHVNHSIVESLGLAITTSLGTVVHTGDYKIDPHALYEDPTNIFRFEELGNKGVLAMLSDSTNAINPGYSLSESKIIPNIEKILLEAKGRVLFATFSSQIHRIQKVLEIAKQVNRKVYITGRSMLENIQLSVGLDVFVQKLEDVIINEHEFRKAPKEKVLILTTGSQGEETAGLFLMANDKHKTIKLDKEDTIVLSSSAIPGNEGQINRLINLLIKRGIRVITNKEIPVHTSGHGYQEELKTMLRAIKPKYFIPVHGEVMHLHKHKQLAIGEGVHPQNIFILENGKKFEFSEKGVRVLEKIPNQMVYIENDRENDITDEILTDRIDLSKNGMVVYTVRGTDGGIEEVEIVSKGFVGRNQRDSLWVESRKLVTEIVQENAIEVFRDRKKVETQIKKELRKLFFEYTGKNPTVFVFVVFHVKQV